MAERRPDLLCALFRADLGVKMSERTQSAAERSNPLRNRSNRTGSLEATSALLLTRAQAAQLLACSIAKLIRLEQRGALQPVRLDPTTRNSRVYYRTDAVHALAEGGAETRATPGGERCFEGAPTGASIPPPLAPSQEGARKNPSHALLEGISTSLAARANRCGYILFRDPLSELVREALADEGYQLTDRRFRLKLWNRPEFARCSKSGRRTSKDRDKFKADAPELQNIVQKLARESTQARC